ncbi:MAG: PPOX class F420-dependent oxidoreductase [Micromonosporaceae bacterium]
MDNLEKLLGAAGRGVLVTLKRDGRPQLSNVAYHYDEPSSTLRISTTDGRAKTKNLRRDPRASFYVTTGDLSAYAVAEGTVTLSEIAREPYDAITDELVEHYRTVRGEHPDWDEFRAAMVAEQRLLIRFPVDRGYGWSP